MIKGTLETSLNEPCDVTVQDPTGIFFGNVFSRIKRYLKEAHSSGNGSGKFGAVRSRMHDSGLLVAFLLYQQRKARQVRQALKDDFFFQRQTRRKNISQRAWNRHSAFLYYSQQIHKQNVQHSSELQQSPNTVVEKPVDSQGRMSFQVKSIKLLPVWATAYHEMSWIEYDISSLRLTQSRRIESLAAEAA